MSIKRIVSNVVMFSYGSLFVLYTVFYRRFAEFNIHLPFLDFPIFVGEAVLIISLILLVIYFREELSKINISILLFYAYLYFVLLKAFYGYYVWGPLSFRNAAMYYYLVYGAITYFVMTEIKIKSEILSLFIVILILVSVMTRKVVIFYLIYYLIIAILLALNCRNRKIGLPLSILIFVLFSYYITNTSSRAIVISFASASIIFILCFLIFILKSNKIKSIFGLMIFGILGVFIYFETDTNSIRSLIPIKEHYEEYKNVRKMTENYYKHNKRKYSVLKLYEKEEVNDIKEAKNNTKYMLFEREREEEPVVEGEQIETEKKQAKAEKEIKEEEKAAAPKKELRDIDNAKNSLRWRMFVISDMLEELISNKRIFGVDFGKPFRSKTVEMLGWHDGWSTGWIEPHNSYVHIIYRTGILGLLFIFIIINTFIRMLIGFIKLKSIPGLLLMSCILYWLMMANFLVVLELPQFAIPFWIFVGATLKYYKTIKEEKQKNISI